MANRNNGFFPKNRLWHLLQSNHNNMNMESMDARRVN